MSEARQYAERDLMGMDDAGNHYCRHISAMTREGLDSKSDIAAELGWRDMQIAALQQKLDAAEAKLADLDKQDPIGYHSEDARAVFRVWPHADGKICVPVYARPAPAINIAELVPGEKSTDVDYAYYPLTKARHEGWNACRVAILRNIEEQSK